MNAVAREARPLRVLVVEDEPLGYRRLLEVLQARPGVEVVGWAQDAPAAVEAIRDLSPDLVFLDIQLPGGTGFDVIQEVGVATMPSTIFLTAFEQYAVEAFRYAALDYVLKPYTDSRIDDALQRVQQHSPSSDPAALTEQLRVLLEMVRTGSPPTGAGAPEPYLKRIAVRTRGRLRIVPISEIDYIEGQGVYAEVHAGTDRYLIRESLNALETRLDPEQFCRIHKSEIVRLDQIDSYFRGGGSYVVQLKTGETLRVGRRYREKLERHLGLA